MSVTSFDYKTFNPAIAVGLDQFDLIASREMFVGFAIAPVLEVLKQSGEYKVTPLKEKLKDYTTIRHNEGTYSRGRTRFDKDSYITTEHGFEVPVDDRESAIHRTYWDAELEAAQLAQDQVLRNHNQRVITAALAGTSITEAADTVWTNVGSADPVKDVRDTRIKIKEATGLVPNALCLNWRVYETLRDCTAIRDRLVNIGLVERGKSQPMLTRELIAQALDLQFLFVSGGQKNADEEPTAPTVLVDQWDNTKALLFIRDDGPSIKNPQYMRTLHWGSDGSSIGGSYDTYPEEQTRGNIFRFRMDTAEKVIYAKAAAVITSVA